MVLTDWARELAQSQLAAPLPRRWAHSQGVAAQARAMSDWLGADADLVEAAAWLHDVGYSPHLVVYGFHPLDGALYLRDVADADLLLCRLVAYHSGAQVEADIRGIVGLLRDSFRPPPLKLLQALTYCDLTTSPDGTPMSVDQRLTEIRTRYGSDTIVRRSIDRAEPMLREATDAVVQAMGSSNRSVEMRIRRP